MAKGLSPRDILPLEIGRYLQDTAHLDATKSGAYLHLLMHYWLHGSLPDEDSELATIARVSPDTWSITRVSVMYFFRKGSDGKLRNPGADKRRSEAVDKHKKAQEKALKAIRTRWARYRDRKAKEEAKNGDTPSITQVQPSIGSVPPEVLPLPSPHTPYLIPSPNPLPGGLTPTPDPPGGERARKRLGSGPDRAGRGKTGKEKAKTTKTPVERSAGFGVGDRVPEIVAPRATDFSVRLTNIEGESVMGIPAEEAGGRFSQFQDEVLRFWSEQNPEQPSCPWTQLDSKALLEYLRGSPGTDLERFKMLLRNRAASGINPRALPRKWVGDLEEYGEGPLDRYAKPVRGVSRQL